MKTTVDMSANPQITYNIDKIDYRPTYNQIALPPMDEAALLRILKELTAPKSRKRRQTAA